MAKSGWTARAPKTMGERRALLARCGAGAFLVPGKLKFPVMAARGSCVVDCDGLRAALSRARQFRHRTAAAKASKLSARATCGWVK